MANRKVSLFIGAFNKSLRLRNEYNALEKEGKLIVRVW